ncbi:MAG TPA: tRNA (adenosine(37)-N6)-dimethylallyltransferase MiaA [Tepiditoga sp.]|nr:tRNA (adenosine(37)-N6)-dimethylallyltransferase MiaA [Tepiditoga sp.]
MKIPVIAGPTAVGKTEIILNIAKELPLEIVCMDSRQIYKYMNIGTAKPSDEEMKTVPHHLFNIITPEEYFSAYEYKILAEERIDEIISRKKIPVLVGGTGFYLDSLINGFFEVNSDYGLRNYLDTFTNEELSEILKKIDRESSERINFNDKKRIIRAIEVFIQTGITMSEKFKETKNKNKHEYCIIALDRERKNLHERINLRVDEMIKNSLIDEVKELISNYDENLNSFKTIGYSEVIEYLKGNYDYETMTELIKRNTRRYARRQIIFLRRYKDITWYNIDDLKIDLITKNIISKIQYEWGEFYA